MNQWDKRRTKECPQSSEQSQLSALQTQQLLFDGQPTAIAGEFAITADYAVTGDHDRNRIGPIGQANRA
jgi:hypothetical protein